MTGGPPIYTRQGDGGQTQVGRAHGVSKCAPVVEALGSLDELATWAGCARAASAVADVREELLWIQHRLIEAGTIISELPAPRAGRADALDIGRLEAGCDRLAASLPALHGFVLPGGPGAAGLLHVARTACRRAERALCLCLTDGGLLHTDGSDTPAAASVALAFLNRLGDWLFLAARWENHLLESPEPEYRPDDADDPGGAADLGDAGAT